MVKELERGIVIVGQGQVGKTKPIPFNAPQPLPQIECVLPYWDGKSARNKRREAERNAKKKRK